MDFLKCSKCTETKEIKYFVKDIFKKEGYRKTCKDCRNKYLIKWNKENSDKRKGYNEKYILNTPLLFS